MRKLLLFFTLFLAAVVVKAAPVDWSDGNGNTVKYDILGDHVRIEVGDAGSLDAFLASDAASAIFSSTPTLLKIEKLGNGENAGKLNATDLAALNSSIYSGLAHFTKVDMSQNDNQKQVSFDIADVSGMNMGGMEYLRLPNGMTSADDVADMGKMQDDGNNANLKVVASCDNSNASIPEMAVYSFSENNLPTAKSTFAGMPWETAKKVRMAGSFGDHDLVDGNSPIWGYGGGAVWDFTDANFANVTLNASSYVVDGPYYHYDDPFEEGSTYTEGANYSTNAFIYFKNYAKAAVDVKLPESLTALPVGSMQYLGAENKENYKLIYGLTEEQFQEQFGASAAFGTIEQLVIPDAVEIMDMSCLNRACIRKVSIGSGIAYIKAGACAYSPTLEEVEFTSGLDHDCYVGDQAFLQCEKIKHITLTEGIVSLGAHCFERSFQVESVSLPSTLVNIGNKCFYQCYALSTITIPHNVRQIGKSAFLQCPLTDIYLMAETPDEVPVIFTAGSDYGDSGADGHATFYSGTLENWNTIPWNGDTPFAGSTLNQMTWDEAAIAFFNSNGMAMLHYNPGVADVVMESISDLYQATSTDGVKLPTMSGGARDLRGRANGEHDMGAAREGTWSKYGWAQFMLLKRFTYEVYEREYDDVWNTICFPFDLTDEQLDVAFNRGFNIVDFSGVEYQDETESPDAKKTLILHFNTVAKTIYKDTDNNIYTETARETDGNYEYNVYVDKQGNEYHHVTTSDKLADNKTKSFCRGTSLSDAQSNFNNKIYPAVEIDGYLASAGHPYMVHPNTGTNSGMPLKRCQFSGITWDHDRDYSQLFEEEARTVDLGVQMGDPTTGTPDANNFLQAAYSQFNGQTYTFKGNAQQYQEGATLNPMPTEGTGENDLHALPSVDDYTSLYPNGPQLDATAAAAKQTVLDTYGPKMTSAPEDPTQNPVDNPAEDTETYPTNFQTFYNTMAGHPYNKIWGEVMLDIAFSDIASGPHDWGGWVYQLQNGADASIGVYFHGSQISNIPVAEFDETKFNALKALCEQYKPAISAYNEWVARCDSYPDDLQAYTDNQDAWNTYESTYAAEEAAYEADMTTYLQNVRDWQSACATVKAHNEQILAAWEASNAQYQRLIPTGAYFLGRQGRGWPKYYREIADDTRENPTGGFWTQYTAVIIPNAAAKAGIEAEIDGTGSQGVNQSVEMVFDEGFLGEEKTSTEIEQIITEAEAEGQKVEYMQVVYNINGQIVREGTELAGLPKGVYIVNGKKYFVK